MVPVIAKFAIIGVASMNAYYIGINAPSFSPLWTTVALSLNWILFSLACILGEGKSDHN